MPTVVAVHPEPQEGEPAGERNRVRFTPRQDDDREGASGQTSPTKLQEKAYAPGEEKPHNLTPAMTVADMLSQTVVVKKDPLVLDQELAKAMAQRKRKWRSFVHVVLLSLIILVWVLTVLPYIKLTHSTTYDAAVGASLEVTSCDVDFVPGDSATITLHHRLAIGGMRTETDDDGGVKGHYFENARGCAELPYKRCRRFCLVVVAVPAGARGSFVVSQGSLDESAPHIRVTKGTTLASLTVATVYDDGLMTSLPSAKVEVDHASITTKLTTRLTYGDVLTKNATLGDVDAESDGPGCIHLLDVPVPDGAPARLAEVYQPSRRVCVATDLPAGKAKVSTPDSPLALCDATSVYNATTGTTAHSLSAESLASFTAHYDEDRDGYVTREEFGKGLTALKTCCGGGCPFVSTCVNAAASLGYTADITQLTPTALASALVATGSASFLPGCATSVEVAPSAAVAPPLALSRLHAAAGDVVVTFRHPQTSPAERKPTQPRTQALVPSGRLPGLRLSDADAKRLRQRYAENYAHPEASEDLYLTIDVRGDGAPPSRWIYATNPAYLVLDPPHISFFTAGTLTPPIAREVVRYFDNDCVGYSPIVYNATRRNETLRAVYTSLVTALRMDPTEDGALRGTLVLLDDTMGTPKLLGQVTMYDFVADHTGTLRIAVWSADMSSQLELAVLLSAVLGALIALLFVALTFKALVYIQRQSYEAQKATRAVVLAKMGLSTEQIKSRLDDADADKPSFNPFMQPFVLLTMLLVEPVRRRWVNSVAKFVRERLTREEIDGLPVAGASAPSAAEEASRTPAGGAASAAEEGNASAPAMPLQPGGGGRKFVYMRNFCQRYELFCMQHGLNQIEDRTEIQRILISRFNTRVIQLQVRRLYNLRWRTPKDDKDDAALAAPPAPAEATPVFAAGSPGGGRTSKDIIRQFCADNTIMDRTPGTFLDMETRNGPNGLPKLGFRPAIFAYCKERDLPLPMLQGEMWAKALPKGAAFRDRQKVRQIYGLGWNDGDALPKVNYKWYCIEALAVFVHVTFVFFFPLCTVPLILYAFNSQDMFAYLLAPDYGVDRGDASLQWLDVLTILPGSDAFAEQKQAVLLCQFVVLEAICFLGLSVLRLFIHYLGISGGKFIFVVKLLYAWILTVHLVIISTYFGIIGGWFVLAAILEPGAYLPYGAAVVALIGVGSTVGGSMLKSAKAFKQRLTTAFMGVLNEKMRKAVEKIEAELLRKAAAKNPELYIDTALPDDESSVGGDVEEVKKQKDVTPSDIFQALQSDSDEDELSMAEFKRIFELLELDLTDNQKEQLFAFCDTDCNGSISEKEFTEGWARMVEVFIEHAADGVGLSMAQIVGVVIYLLLMLGLLISFILLALSAWNTNSNFGSSVQTAAIAGASNLTTKLRKKSAAEDPDQLDDIVEGTMDSQADAVEGE